MATLGDGDGDGDTLAAFDFDPAFARSGIEVASLVMPLSRDIYTFRGLPGLLTDALWFEKMDQNASPAFELIRHEPIGVA